MDMSSGERGMALATSCTFPTLFFLCATVAFVKNCVGIAKVWQPPFLLPSLHYFKTPYNSRNC
jgi:hypothetical protein